MIYDYGLNFLAPLEKRGLIGYVDDAYWNERGGGDEPFGKEKRRGPTSWVNLVP